MIYLSAIETLICIREMSLKGSTSVGFAQNMIIDFLRKMPQKVFLQISKTRIISFSMISPPTTHPILPILIQTIHTYYH